MLFSLLALPMTGPARAAWWIGKAIHDRALEQMNDPATLKARLAHLEKLLLSEQITEDEFEALELEILTRLRDIQRAGGPKGGAR